MTHIMFSRNTHDTHITIYFKSSYLPNTYLLPFLRVFPHDCVVAVIDGVSSAYPMSMFRNWMKAFFGNDFVNMSAMLCLELICRMSIVL